MASIEIRKVARAFAYPEFTCARFAIALSAALAVQKRFRGKGFQTIVAFCGRLCFHGISLRPMLVYIRCRNITPTLNAIRQYLPRKSLLLREDYDKIKSGA